MAEAIVWLDGKAKSGKEKICPGRHVRQSEWKSAWNDTYITSYDKHPYDYISDYECIFNHPIDDGGNCHLQDDPERWKNLQEAKKQGTKVSITHLAHFTNWNAAEQICETKGFKGEKKKINEGKSGQRVTKSFSWWSPIFTSRDINYVRDHLGEAIKPFLEEEDNLLQNQFATSDAFLPNPSRYGSSLFQYRIEELCRYYSQHVKDELRYKILGTFGYKQEVMHAVLVCSRVDGAGQFADYPDVLSPAKDLLNEAVITCDDEGKWVWKPQATGSKITRLQAHGQAYHNYRRWENVAFAFHIPDGEIMKCDRPADHRKIIKKRGEIVAYPVEDEKD